MAAMPHSDAKRRHDFVLLFDVHDGNPNGDPDAGNLPRLDPQTMQGLVSDVATKRKVRDWVDLARGDEGRFKIYVQSGEALNTKHQRAYDEVQKETNGGQPVGGIVEQARRWMCHNFYDIRMFGAVMTTRVNCGQVRGPVQLTFARSIDPIVPLDLSITREAVTREEDKDKEREMGRKAVVPYGLYRAYGFYNPHFAEQTGADDEDLELFWDALQKMWDVDRSASRGLMACQGLYVFTHESPLGNAPAQRLFELVDVPKSAAEAPRSFADYRVTVDEAAVPAGVTLTRLVG